MALIDKLNDAIAAEKQQFVDYKAATDQQLADKDATIADLQSQLANAVTSDQIDAAVTSVGEIVP